VRTFIPYNQSYPHFFFNTLNSLYSLSLMKSDKTPEMILKLSELMRFIIYESGDEFVPMEKQLDFIKNYIYIEGNGVKIRDRLLPVGSNFRADFEKLIRKV